ncbi:MAG: hypothetical protein HKP25_03970 [Marinicaulis sp.]|nr:hypothetical protein [Marinicaulis sp.]
MPYGTKRGIKTPGEFGATDMFGLALAGASGIIAALVTDFQQQGEASALFTINQWVIAAGGVLGFTNIPLWMVVTGITLIGAMSIFYFQPITRQGAFAQGFGLLAVIMTATPPDLAGGLEAINESLPGLEPAVAREANLNSGITTAAFMPSEGRVIAAQDRRAGDKYELNLRIVFSEGIPANIDTMIRRGTIRGRLHNESTDETWNLFRSAGGTIKRDGNALLIQAGVPARTQSARLWTRIECAGYSIEEVSKVANLAEPVNWEIIMRPSSMPLFLQRLGKSYWF